MFKGCRVAVVVPAFNEARKIARTLRSIPGFVDHVIVVDDASADGTGRIAKRSQRRGLAVIRHDRNRGVGAAIATGYAAAFEAGADVSAVMAGDSQMDPADLMVLIDTHGAVTNIRVLQPSGNKYFDEIILRDIREAWVFSPAVKKGHKVRCLLQQNVRVSWTNASPFESK